MEKYRRKVKIRAICMIIVIFCLMAAYLYLSWNKEILPVLPDFIRGFHFGAFLGVEFVMIFFAVKYFIALRSEKGLKKLNIVENDERTMMIQQKSGALGMSICGIGLAAATVIAGFFDQTVFFSLLGATIFVGTVRLFFKIYYMRKI